jgi:iron(III) transport system substrate-binding protein
MKLKVRGMAIVGLMVCLLIGLGLSSPSEAKDYITCYGSTTADILERFAKIVDEKTGIEVRWRYHSCGEIRAKVMAEAPNFQADMVVMVCSPEMDLFKEKGWLIPYESPVSKKVVRDWGKATPSFVKDPENMWLVSDFWHFVLLGNKNMLKQKGYKMPESWDELLDPKWKDQIIMPSPLTSGTAFTMLYSFMTHYGFNKGKGEEGGWAYLKALDKNINHYTRSGNAPTDLVSRGEFMLGISGDETVIIRIREGYPVEWKIPKEGIGYDAHYSGILKGTKKEAITRKVLDYLASDDHAKFMADLGYVSGSPKYPSVLYGRIPTYIPNINNKWANDNKTRLCNEWKDKFLRK